MTGLKYSPDREKVGSIEIHEKAWVYEFPGTKVQDDDLIYVSFVLSICNEVKSSASYIQYGNRTTIGKLSIKW